MTSFLASADLDAQFGIGLNGVVPSRLQHGDVQKNIARAIGQLKEAKAFFRVEPLDDAIKCRPAGGRLFSASEWLTRGSVV